LRQPVRALELLQATPDGRRFAVVVVDGRVRLPLERLRVRALELVDELLERCHRGAQRTRAVRGTLFVGGGADLRALFGLVFGRRQLRQLERDLDPRERLRDRARELRPLCDLAKLVVRDLAVDLDGRRQLRADDPDADLEADGGGRLDLERLPAAADETGGERHREARSVRGGEELLRARQARLLVRASRPRHLELGQLAARRGDDLALAVEEGADPLDLDSPFRCHYAITSTRRSAGASRPSRSRTSRSARIETSSWSSVGSRVVRRCSHRPGASAVMSKRFSLCFPANRMSSYAIPAITGSSAMRETISQYQAGRPKSAKTNTPITITHSRNAVPQRGWISEWRCVTSGVSSSPAS